MFPNYLPVVLFLFSGDAWYNHCTQRQISGKFLTYSREIHQLLCIRGGLPLSLNEG